MTNFQRLATVRTRFLSWLQDAEQTPEGLGPEGSLICRESMLIRDEFFCGRKFHAQHYTAVWFIEEDVLKIYRADDSLELVLRGAEIDGCETVESEIVESTVEQEQAAPAVELQVQGQSASDKAISEHAPEDPLESLGGEPQILKLTTAQEDGEDSRDSSAHGTGEMQPNEQRAGGMDSGEQGIRKAA